MKQVLGVRLGQQLALTPQMQQSIKLMRLSTLELRQEILQTVECNPMLELQEDEYEEDWEANDDDAGDDGEADDPGDDEGDEAEGAEAEDGEAELATIPDELALDVSWDDIYPVREGGGVVNGAAEDDGFEERSGTGTSLRDDLLWQLNLTTMPERLRLAALVVIDSIDEDGMLTAACNELAHALEPKLRLRLSEIEKAVRVVQGFDPPGVCARDLAECLLLQLERLPTDTPRRVEAMRVVRRHFPLLARQDLPALQRRARLSETELDEVLALIRRLHPRPGAAVGDATVEYVVPDVVVRKHGGRWSVELNRETMPRVRVHHAYAQYIKAGDTSADNLFLRDNLQDAKGFVKNLEYRNETLLKVAANIVERQRGFLEHGAEAMVPLVMAEVAAAVDRHDSTISRVTTGKYMETPHGVFELKYFFSNQVGDAGSEVSSTAIRAVIKKLTAEEDPRKPLSDVKIAALLKERGIQVARRTVAKYREALAIPPSNERKRLL